MPSDTANEIMQVIDRWRARAVGVLSHQSRQVAGHPVAWWFDQRNATTVDFLTALSLDAAFVVPGDPANSRLFTTFMDAGRPMGQTLGADTEIVRRWIAEGCRIPEGARITQPERERALPLPTPAQEKEAFHKLVNIERFPEFRPTAMTYARAYLENANFAAMPVYAKFTYSETALDDRMNEIYDAYSVPEKMYALHFFDDPIVGTGGKRYLVGAASNKAVVDDLVQKAPFNFLDGVWLQNIMTARPSDSVMSKLFDIWADEVGNGEVEQNHANVYDNLLKSQGVYLPAINSLEFTEYAFVDGAWTAGVFQQCVGLSPQEFLPELLGMTLLLEWEATPTLTPTVRMLRGRGIDPLFYQLHVAIDNISEGHGALAKEAIKTFLEEKRQEGGESEVQKNWERIWNGYVTWATVGFGALERFTRRLIIDKKRINLSNPDGTTTCYPNLAEFYRSEMLSLVATKAPIAKQVHAGVVIAGRPLQQLFDDPPALLEALVSDRWVDPSHPRDSKLLELMKFTGPMYRVFSERDQEVVLDWIESLGEEPYECIDPLPDDSPTDSAAKFLSIIVGYAGTAKFQHGEIVLSTPDFGPKPLAQLFDAPQELMAALVVSGWVVPSKPERSFFLTRILTNGGPMEGVFTSDEVAVVSDWIREGAKLPDSRAVRSVLMARGDAADLLRKLDLANLRTTIGMGTVH